VKDGVSTAAMVADPKLALERVVAGEGVELLDPEIGRQLLRELLDATATDGPLLVFARGADAGTPFVLIARPRPREEEIEVSDPCWEVGEVD